MIKLGKSPFLWVIKLQIVCNKYHGGNLIALYRFDVSNSSTKLIKSTNIIEIFCFDLFDN